METCGWTKNEEANFENLGYYTGIVEQQIDPKGEGQETPDIDEPKLNINKDPQSKTTDQNIQTDKIEKNIDQDKDNIKDKNSFENKEEKKGNFQPEPEKSQDSKKELSQLQKENLLQFYIAANQHEIKRLTNKNRRNSEANLYLAQIKIKADKFLDQTYSDIKFFPSKKIKFYNQWKELFAKAIKIDESNIEIITVEKGSFNFYMFIDSMNEIAESQLIDDIQKTITEPQEIHLELSNYLLQDTLFTPRKFQYNAFQHYFFDCIKSRYRGPPEKKRVFNIPHYPWYKLALKVGGEYDNGSNKWMSSTIEPGAWNVVYYACNSKLALIQINAIITTYTTLPMNHQNNSAFLCYSNINDAQKDCTQYEVALSKYQFVFQCRANPEALRPEQNDTVYKLENPDDIRPYGLLIYYVGDIQP